MARAVCKIMGKKLSITVLGLSLLTGLAACHSDFGPSPMPSGYKYHHDVYQAPPGPEPVFKKLRHRFQDEDQKCGPETVCMSPAEAATYRRDMPAVPVEPVAHTDSLYPYSPAPALSDSDKIWQEAANDLTMRMLNALGAIQEPVYMAPGEPLPERGFEAALEQAMRERGVDITPHPGTGPFELRYHITAIGPERAQKQITITLRASGTKAAEQSGIYMIEQTSALPRLHDATRPALTEAAVPLLRAPDSVPEDAQSATAPPQSWHD